MSRRRSFDDRSAERPDDFSNLTQYDEKCTIPLGDPAAPNPAAQSDGGFGGVTSQPSYGTQQPAGYAQPSYGTQQPAGYAQPSYGTQQPAGYAQPSFGTQQPSGYAQPSYGTQQPAGYSQPSFGTQQPSGYAQPSYGTQPPVGYSQPSFGTQQPSGYSQPSYGSQPPVGYASDMQPTRNADEIPMVFALRSDSNVYVYEYSDRLEYYRNTPGGMIRRNVEYKKR